MKKSLRYFVTKAKCTYNRRQDESYVSIATNSSTEIDIDIYINKALYDTYEARITNESGTYVGFDVGVGTKVKALNPDIVNHVQLFTNAYSGTAEVEVWAIKGSGATKTEVCLAGDKTKGDIYINATDRLIVKVFTPYTFPYDFNLYLVESSFSTDAETWKNNFNEVLKQMVAELQVSNVYVHTWTSADNYWDFNGNGTFDIVSGAGLDQGVDVPGGLQIFSETYSMAVQADDGCSNNPSKVYSEFVIKGSLRTHWVLEKDYNKDDPDDSLTLYLNNVDNIDILRNITYFKIVEFYDSEMDEADHWEVLSVDAVNIFTTPPSIKFHNSKPGAKALKKNYSASDGITIWCDVLHAGLTDFAKYDDNIPRSCSFCQDGNDYKLFMHEFLHQGRNNFFRHVGRSDIDNANFPPYTDNIMFNGKSTNTKLRNRELYIPFPEYMHNTTYSQWERIRE